MPAEPRGPTAERPARLVTVVCQEGQRWRVAEHLVGEDCWCCGWPMKLLPGS